MYFCSMERRIKFIYGLTICAIVACSIVQGYWLYSRYQLSLEEYKSELYDTIIACAEEDKTVRKALPNPPRLYGNRFRKVNAPKGNNDNETWTCEIIAFDTLHHSLAIPKDVDAPTYLLEYITNHDDTHQSDMPDGMECFKFTFENKEGTENNQLLEALDRFVVDLQHPFQKNRLDSILRSRSIVAQSVITTKADTMAWQPFVQTHGSIWHPVMEVYYPYDIFEGQQVVVTTSIGISPIIRRIAYTLLMTVLLSVFLIFCLVYQILTIRKQRHIEAIRQEFLNTMIHELKRHFSKLRDITLSDATEIPLVKSRFSLRSLTEECIGKQNIPTGKEVKMDIVAEGDVEVWADRMHLANIICNLLENAIKYSREAVTISIDYQQRTDGLLQISIADNGIGIAKADQRYVFDKFYRSETAKDKSIPGIGLGLSYVKLLVEAHGGTITFESTEGQGTTFTIIIPQTDGKDKDIAR